ncbi:MAG TPA: AMP-binding protein, partial [Desulfotignum sp.]|nr:AMP-binding protein [Desulfotignum sp.]
MTDYDKEYKEFKWQVPEYYNFAGDVFDKWAEDKNKLAMLWVDDHGTEIRKTFHELSVASRKMANLFKFHGIGQGDVVIVVLPRNIEWWIAFTACIRCGAMIAPGTTQLTAKDLEYRANKSNAA